MMCRWSRCGCVLIVLMTLAAPAWAQEGDRAKGPPGGRRPDFGKMGGPYAHKVCSASSADGRAWSRDEGIRIEHASVPCAVNDGDRRILLYYVDADRGPGLCESVGCAVSTDGSHFEKQRFSIEGLPSEKAVDPSVLKDEAGSFRLYYFSSGGHGDPASVEGPHEIRLALSGDGVHFKDAGLAFAREGLVDPDVFCFRRTWFMYVFARGATVIATSRDGKAFAYRQDLDLPGWGTTAPILLKDGRLRLYAFEQRRRTGNVVRSFISSDGFQWTPEPGDRLRAGEDEQITDPYVIRWKSGYKMFFKLDPSAGPRRPPE